MATESIRVDGINKVVRDLKRFGVEVADLKTAFNKIGNIVVKEAVTLTPTLTGRLAASIRASKTQNKSEVRAGGARVPYAGVQHYGGYNNITGSYFLTKAIGNKREEVINTMETDLNALIQRLGLK